MRPMRKNLVLARVGAASLHPGWIDAGTPRDFDVRLIPYQEIPEEPELDLVVGDVIPGPKWTGIRELLNSWDGWREYDHIWLPDDDIRAGQDAIDGMFAAAEGLGLDLFAPALDEQSHFAHFTTMQNPSFFARRVGFVEIMVPGFSRPTLERLLETLDLSETGWGWGLDSVWPKILGYENVGVIDGVTVTHTRPVGVMRDEDLRRRVLAESDMMFERYECEQVHATFDAVGPDLQSLELSAEELLAELARGWQYLVARDPRILAWIAEYQRPYFDWEPYPVAGTPC
jgi:hypothetical protein